MALSSSFVSKTERKFLPKGSDAPGQIIVTHPFNPVYLLPLIEVVTTDANDAAFIEAAKAELTGLGLYPLHVKKEIDAHTDASAYT